MSLMISCFDLIMKKKERKEMKEKWGEGGEGKTQP